MLSLAKIYKSGIFPVIFLLEGNYPHRQSIILFLRY